MWSLGMIYNLIYEQDLSNFCILVGLIHVSD